MSSGQIGTSLDAVEQDGSYTGSAITPTDPFQRASMVVSMADYAAGDAVGGNAVQVELQGSHDGTNWATLGAVNYGEGQDWCAVDFPGVELRAVITQWGANVTAGSVTATVCGI